MYNLWHVPGPLSSSAPINHLASTAWCPWVCEDGVNTLEWVFEHVCAFKHVYSNNRLFVLFFGMYVCVCARLSLKLSTNVSECESAWWQNLMCHLGDMQTKKRTDCPLGKYSHTHTHTHFTHRNTWTSQMAGDWWLVLQNSWKEMEGEGVREDSLFLCSITSTP